MTFVENDADVAPRPPGADEILTDLEGHFDRETLTLAAVLPRLR